MFLRGIRVIELADEIGEYAGKVLAGLGADVIKVEPPGGESTRRIGPFYLDSGDPDQSLYFWNYNFGKRGVIIDDETDEGKRKLAALIASADVLLETRGEAWMQRCGLARAELAGRHPRLVHVRVSAFGDSGPWSQYKGSDLVHLALGGVMMNCGYSPDPEGNYDTPPVAPAMWQAYHITGEMAAYGVVGALNHRLETGEGQYLAVSVHDAVSKNTETDIPNWVFARRVHLRQTCRHSSPLISGPTIGQTADGRWLLPYRTYLRGYVDAFPGTVRLMAKHGMQLDLEDAGYLEPEVRTSEKFNVYYGALVDRFIRAFSFDREIWREAQAEGLPWAPLRRPEEILQDEHFLSRRSFADVEHPELGRTFRYVVAKWLAPGVPWRTGPRAPLMGEHNDEIFTELPTAQPAPVTAAPPKARPLGERPLSKRGKPFALDGIRIIDLSWLLASGGAGRFLTALGAEVIKIEHLSRVDGMRFSNGPVPPGGRAQRDAATGPLMHTLGPKDWNRGGGFMEINSGKRSFSLDLKTAEGRAILSELIKTADVVTEGFSPGTMERMGFGYERLKELKPDIVYVQQSGLGQAGVYGRLRCYGPVAAAFAGLTEMSGLPEPYPPAGIGYSYLDWFGAYNMALAIVSALYRRRVTGEGCWVDSSQVETGMYLTGTAPLDFAANGRRWQRYGNASPYKPAAPHAAFRTSGKDRWIAIACFTDEEWRGLVGALGDPSLLADPAYATLAARLEHSAQLESHLGELTVFWDGYELMAALQANGVPAGVCQSAEDRCEIDPQLKHDGWQVELRQRDNGWWPVKEIPVKFEKTPAYIGGPFDRSGPSYAQDNDYVQREILGLSQERIDELTDKGIF
jgi:crotonobetainyl-CoA:carnitine CoA-transferase CaiB-like acyl-CoA transferase